MGLPYSSFDHSRAHYFRYDEHVSLCLEKQRSVLGWGGSTWGAVLGLRAGGPGSVSPTVPPPAGGVGGEGHGGAAACRLRHTQCCALGSCNGIDAAAQLPARRWQQPGEPLPTRAQYSPPEEGAVLTPQSC